jgi:ABC-2 type transport system permease protein/lipopolysaccharide transport system permease protein
MVTTSLALSLVFGVLQGQNLKTALPFVMGGLLAYGLVGFMFNDGPEIFMGAGGTIKNHAYPFTYFVFEGVTKSFMIFLHNLVVYIIAVALMGAFVIPHWTLIPGLLIVLATMFFWGTFFAMMASRFRDMRFMMPYISQILFFMTPIFWHPDANLTGMKSLVIKANPVYGLVEIIRSPLLGQAPAGICWGLSLGALVTGMIAWAIVFGAFRRRIPFWV